MSHATINGHRWATTAVLLVGGCALAAATWVSGDHALAVALVAAYAVFGAVAFWWAGRDGDVAAILRAGGDERQQLLDRDATALAGLAMIAVAIVGGLVSAAVNHGDLGVYGLFAAVGGISYAVALAILRRGGEQEVSPRLIVNPCQRGGC